MRLAGSAIVPCSLLLLAGCSGGTEEAAPPAAAPAPADAVEACDETSPPRREFVILRELVRQHGLQRGNEPRTKTIESSLRKRFPDLLDKGTTDEERRIYREAEDLFKSLPRDSDE